MAKKTNEEIKQTKTSLAKKLGVSRGMLYYQHKRPLTDEALKEDILKVMDEHKSYGHKRIAIELKLNKKRILRVMKKFHLKPIKRRGKNPQKPDDLGKPETKYQNFIETFCPIKPDIVWVGDFTHIRFHNNWVYLSTVMDIYTREILGWHLSINHQRDLVIEAFLDSLDQRKVAPIYSHSNQGSEYESEEYLNLIESNGVIVSMSRKSHPWENGYQESFFGRFKDEAGDRLFSQDSVDQVEIIIRNA